MVYDYENSRIIYVDSTNGEVRAFYPEFPTSQASTSVMIDNVSTMKAIHLTSDGNILLGGTDNNIYYVEDFSGIIDFSDSQDKADYFTDICLMPADIYDISTDGNDNIYCSDIGNKIYQIKQPYYMITQLNNLPTVSTSYIKGIDIEPSPEKLLLATYYSTGGYFLPTINPYIVDTQTTESYIYRAVGKGPIPVGDSPRIIYLNNGDILIYYIYYNGSGHSQDLYYLNSSDSYSETLLLRVSDSSSWKGCFKDMVVDENGLIYLGDDTGGFIAVDAGGVIESYPYTYTMSLGGGSSLSSTFDYINKDVDSIYNTYYNNSNLEISYNIKTDLLIYNSATEGDLATDFKENYKFRIDLLNPDGINEQSYNIYTSQMTEETQIIEEGLFTLNYYKQYSISGNTKFSNNINWNNGTWTIKLYEQNTNTSASTLLSSDTFSIINEQSDSNIIIDNEPDNTNGIVIAETIFNSPYFYALLIIMAVAGTGALFAGGIGFLGGATIGVFVSGGFGLIPMWLILTLIIVFIVLFALIGGKSIGGGE